jgi:hypothetical protein
VASPPMEASALQSSLIRHISKQRSRCHLRSLRILRTTPHDHIRRARLCSKILLPHIPTRRNLLKQPTGPAKHAGHILSRITRHNTQQALPSFFGQIGLLEHTLRAVEVREIERRATVAGVEDRSESDPWLERGYHDSVHFIVDNMACGAEVDGVDDFVVAVVFIAIQIFRLSSMSCSRLAFSHNHFYVGLPITHLSSGKTVNRSASRL